MTSKVSVRQHAVNDGGSRSRAGEAFNDVLGQVITLNRYFTAAAETLTKPAGQSLARWLVLGECKDAPASVSDVARRLHLARQSVQRVADILVNEGLCVYRENPRHQRAQLLALTAVGRRALTRIERGQREWSDELGARIGERVLRQAHAALVPVVEAIGLGDPDLK